MELIDYARMLKKRWLWVTYGVIFGFLAAGTWATTAPNVYRASTELFFSSAGVPGTSQETGAAQSASRFTLDRMQSYAALVDSPLLTRRIIDELDLSLTPDELANRLGAAVPAGTVVLRISASSRDAGTAADIANAAANALVEIILQLEGSTNGGQPPFRITVTGAAAAPQEPSSPDVRLAIGLGLVAGLGIGLVLASLREQASRRPAEDRVGSAATGAEEPRMLAHHSAETALPPSDLGSRPPAATSALSAGAARRALTVGETVAVADEQRGDDRDRGERTAITASDPLATAPSALTEATTQPRQPPSPEQPGEPVSGDDAGTSHVTRVERDRVAETDVRLRAADAPSSSPTHHQMGVGWPVVERPVQAPLRASESYDPLPASGLSGAPEPVPASELIRSATWWRPEPVGTDTRD